VRGARRPDPSARWKSKGTALRARLSTRDALAQAIRDVNQSTEPVKVGEWLVRQGAAWFPAPCWAVVARDNSDRLTVMADSGLNPGLGPSLWATAEWVMSHGTELLTADLSKDPRGGGRGNGTVMGLPLHCRGRVVGALVGIDPQPSSQAPSLGAGLMLALRGILEPAAIALDNSLAIQKASALSVTDDLTLLSNSRHLNEVLRRETKRAMRSGRPLSMLFLDLDGFKQVNDRHGHQAGSKALQEAGAVIRSCARETDVVARFGGDEFALILPDTGPDGARAVAQRIGERVRSNIFLQSDGLAVRLTASIGVATLPDVAQTAEDLLRVADTAMYKVKYEGKDGIHVA
jgi:diguanylate cyclase (GGDEF)-like protein